MPGVGVDPSGFKTYDEFATAAMQSPKFQAIPAHDPKRAEILGVLRDKYYEAHGIHKDLGPTDIVPPNPERKAGAEGDLPAPSGPLTRAPDTVLRGDPAPAKTPLGPEKPPEGPDLAGKVKAGAEKGLSWLQEGAGSEKGIMDPVALLVHALPGDNIQAGIDAALGLSMLTGAGEAEATGGLAYKAIRMLPAPLRGLGRLAVRTAIPTVGGAVGGATEGKTGTGAVQGAAEQLVAEPVIGATRGLFGLAGKAIQKTDIKGMGNWLQEKLPNFPGLKSFSDFRKLFLRGEFEDSASEQLAKVEKKIGQQLEPKPAAPATIFSPQGQDTAQQEALASVSKTNGKAPFTLPKTSIVEDDEGVPTENISIGPDQPKSTIFTPKTPKDVAYKKVKDIEAELKAAKDAIPKLKKSGSGLSAENAEINKRATEAEAKLSEIRTRLKAAQAEARAVTKGKAPIDLGEAVKESQRRAAAGEGVSAAPSTYTPSPKQTNTFEIELPGPMVDYLNSAHKLGIPRRTKLPFEWQTFTDYLSEVENKGWALVGNPDPAKEAEGKALRSIVFQAETNAADAIRSKVGEKAANEWLAARQQYRAARTLTQLFRSPNLVDHSGHIAWDELQQLVDAAGKEGYYDDLKFAFGKDGADSFVDRLHRGEPNIRDKPGKGMNFSLFAHPRLASNMMSGRIHPPSPPLRAGDVPFNLGRNRAISLIMILGPERAAQTISDLVRMGNAAQPKQ